MYSINNKGRAAVIFPLKSQYALVQPGISTGLTKSEVDEIKDFWMGKLLLEKGVLEILNSEPSKVLEVSGLPVAAEDNPITGEAVPVTQAKKFAAPR